MGYYFFYRLCFTEELIEAIQKPVEETNEKVHLETEEPSPVSFIQKYSAGSVPAYSYCPLLCGRAQEGFFLFADGTGLQGRYTIPYDTH